MEHAQSDPAIEGLIEERNEETRSFVSFALLERLFVLQDNLFAAVYFSNNSSSYFIHSKRIALPQVYSTTNTQTNSVALYLHYFSFRFRENRHDTIICIFSGYEFSHHSNASFLFSTIPVKVFSPYIFLFSS